MTRNGSSAGTSRNGTLKIGRLRKYALNRLGVKPRDRAMLDEIMDKGIAALDRTAAPDTRVATAATASSDDQQGALTKLVAGEHAKFNELLIVLQAGLHAYLVGPAGSGKTTAAESCARRLGLDFYPKSVGPQSTQSELLGYMNSTGQYVSTVFRKAFEFGGLFLLDEIDAGNASVLTILNAALANGYCSFPDGVVKRHDNFRCVAAANTFGSGADRQYVGRNQLDAASIDRFAFIEWGYDEVLEAALAPNAEWTAYVQRVRHAVDALKIRHVVSPRASISGGKLLKAGANKATVAEMVLWKGMDAVSRAKVQAAIA